MTVSNKTLITIQTTVNAPIKKVWKYWTGPEHITKWNNASDDWHTPHAVNDLSPGGKFLYRMEARDESFGFDFGGIYDEVRADELISYTIGDGRKVRVSFTANGNSTDIEESFEAESVNPIEMQRVGWQNILDNFKKYTESH